MNYLTTKNGNKAAVVYVSNGNEVVSFPASLNKSIPSLDEVEAMLAPVVKGVTTVRIANGEFDVLKDGVATGYKIINSCLGMSGSGPNVYLISKDGAVKQSGLTLQRAKKMMAQTLK